MSNIKEETEKKDWIFLVIALVAIVTIFIVSTVGENKSNITETTKMTETEVESYTIESISLKTKTVNNAEYQILELLYYNPDDNKEIEKQFLVDLNAGNCLWDSKSAIKTIDNNENFHGIYENSILFEKGEENKITIVKDFYTTDLELDSLSIKITLTKENYSKIKS